MASSGIEYLKTEEGYWTSRKEDGQYNQINTITMHGDIAVIHVDGALSYRTDGYTAYYGEDTYNSIEAAFDKCLNDSSVKGIIFDFNSPGGETNGVAELANKIFESRGSKPYGIVSHTGGSMCSAAYWLGSACEKVYGAENSSIGSIGTLCTFTKYNENFIKVQTIVSDLSPEKNPDPNDEEGLKNIKTRLNDLTSVFIASVAKFRGVSYETVKDDFGQGRVFVGKKAVDAGLADDVMDIESICKQMKTNNGDPGMASITAKTEKSTDASTDVLALEKERINAINAVFSGIDIDKTKAEEFTAIGSAKTVAEAKEFAFACAKEQLVGIKEKLVKAQEETASAIARAEEAENKAKAAEEKASKGLSEREKEILNKAMDEENENHSEIQGGANPDSSKESSFEAMVKACGEKHYNKRRTK